MLPAVAVSVAGNFDSSPPSPSVPSAMQLLELAAENIAQVSDPPASAVAALGGEEVDSTSISETSLDQNPSRMYEVAPPPEPLPEEEARAPWLPNSSRADVGAFAVLCGNWGGSRGNRELARQIDADLKKSPGSVLLLQEAHQGAVANLTAAVEAPSGARGSGPETGASAQGAAGARGSGLAARPEAAFLVTSGREGCNTLLTAARASLVSELRFALWSRSEDGQFSVRSGKATAMSRVLFCDVTFHRPQSGLDKCMFANVHIHHATAKKQTGTAAGHTAFFDALARGVKDHRVRVLGGDFNMSLLIVADMLRERGLEVVLAAWHAFQKKNVQHVDSCGIFLLGPAVSIRPLHTARDLETFNLPVTDRGMGFELGSYLPKKSGAALAALRRSLAAPAVAGPAAVAAADGPAAAASATTDPAWPVLPPWHEKAINSSVFDPQGLLGAGGAHTPLLGFMGVRSFRSEDAWARRSAKKAEKRQEKRKGKGSLERTAEEEGA